MTEEAFFGDGDGSERWLILNDMDQVMPDKPLRVTGREKQQTVTGKTMRVLTLEDEEKNEYRMAAWKRDVRACLQQWGTNVDPLEWGPVVVVMNQQGTRFILKPAEGSEVKEEKIGEER